MSDGQHSTDPKPKYEPPSVAEGARIDDGVDTSRGRMRRCGSSSTSVSNNSPPLIESAIEFAEFAVPRFRQSDWAAMLSLAELNGDEPCHDARWLVLEMAVEAQDYHLVKNRTGSLDSSDLDRLRRIKSAADTILSELEMVEDHVISKLRERGRRHARTEQRKPTNSLDENDLLWLRSLLSVDFNRGERLEDHASPPTYAIVDRLAYLRDACETLLERREAKHRRKKALQRDDSHSTVLHRTWAHQFADIFHHRGCSDLATNRKLFVSFALATTGEQWPASTDSFDETSATAKKVLELGLDLPPYAPSERTVRRYLSDEHLPTTIHPKHVEGTRERRKREACKRYARWAESERTSRK